MITGATILDQKLKAAEIPIAGISLNEDGSYRVDFLPGTTQAQRDQAAGIISAFNLQEVIDKQTEMDTARSIAKTWFSGQQAAIDFVRMTPAAQATAIDSMTLAQLRTVVKYVTIAVSMLIKRELL